MSQFIHETFERLLDEVPLKTKRYLYPHFEVSRLTGLIGPRGVGKTTLLLQTIKEHYAHTDEAFYFTADSVYFQQTSLLEFVNDLYQTHGYKLIFIDEVHKYHNWSQELKNLYDAFPKMRIVFSGSSMLDIVKGSHDLSRRARIFHLPGMSFREYLQFKHADHYDPIGFDALLKSPKNFKSLGSIEKIKGEFKRYLKMGYYPFGLEEEHTYYERVLRVVEKTIYEDIANFYQLKTPNLPVFQKILSFLASIPPGEVNTHNIAKNLGIANQTIDNYLNILQEVGLIHMVFPFEGGNQLLRKPKKIFLHNTSLFNALEQYIGEPTQNGTQRELYFLQALRDAGIKTFFSKVGDFRTEKTIFEIGGKNKTFAQLKKSDLNAYLVKDDILIPSPNTIPLFYFGFLY